jgi:ribA/ribD-fused uncharacterized protein
VRKAPPEDIKFREGGDIIDYLWSWKRRFETYNYTAERDKVGALRTGLSDDLADATEGNTTAEQLAATLLDICHIKEARDEYGLIQAVAKMRSVRAKPRATRKIKIVTVLAKLARQSQRRRPNPFAKRRERPKRVMSDKDKKALEEAAMSQGEKDAMTTRYEAAQLQAMSYSKLSHILDDLEGRENYYRSFTSAETSKREQLLAEMAGIRKVGEVAEISTVSLRKEAQELQRKQRLEAMDKRRLQDKLDRYRRPRSPRVSNTRPRRYSRSRSPRRKRSRVSSNQKEVIKFYHRHAPYFEFTNFFGCPIELGGKKWATVEHYFQGQKFHRDPELQERIRLQDTPRQAFYTAHHHESRVRKDWHQVSLQIMRRGVEAKFLQHPTLQRLLLDTGDADLVEHTRDDSFWGDGGDGSGQNHLGRILMAVRSEIRARKSEAEHTQRRNHQGVG